MAHLAAALTVLIVVSVFITSVDADTRCMVRKGTVVCVFTNAVLKNIHGTTGIPL
jgi:hypothetical protein